jgi:hypothetical protein
MTHTDPFAPPLPTPETGPPGFDLPEVDAPQAPDEAPAPTPDPVSPIRSPQDPG